MDLDLSVHEIITKCTQALKAPGFSPGLDIENGKNIGWLASYGLPSLEILYEEIGTDYKNRTRQRIDPNITENAVHFPSQSHSTFSLAQSIVDYAEIGKSVHVKHCRFPLLIFAEMSRRVHLPYGFKLEWIEKGRHCVALSKAGKSTISNPSIELTDVHDLRIISVENPIITNPLELLRKKKEQIKLVLPVAVIIGILFVLLQGMFWSLIVNRAITGRGRR